MPSILIWTQRIDVHADLVVRELMQLGADVTRINGDDYPVRKSASFKFPNSASRDQNFDSVWYRRRIDPVIDEHLSPAAQTFAMHETRAFLDGMLLSATNAYWVNDFASALRARNKIYQLSIAESCGLSVPPTLISNEPKEVLAFAAEHEKFIYKPLHSGLVSIASEKDKLIYTNIVEPKHLRDREQDIRAVPGIYQAYIPKQTELRITVVGQHIFACAIDSQTHATTRVDWRHYHPDMQHTQAVLPKEVREQIHTYMDAMQLEFGAIDMILTPEGHYVFLEINQMGQWAWIQNATGMLIAKTFAQLLYDGKKGGVRPCRKRYSPLASSF